MRQNKLPMSLIADPTSSRRSHLLDVQSFEDTFGPKSHRKRPKLSVGDVSEMAQNADEVASSYDASKDRDIVRDDDGSRAQPRDYVFGAGGSKRIWNELYKASLTDFSSLSFFLLLFFLFLFGDRALQVVDASDVLIQVLDARDPQGTRSPHIEEFLAKEVRNPLATPPTPTFLVVLLTNFFFFLNLLMTETPQEFNFCSEQVRSRTNMGHGMPSTPQSNQPFPATNTHALHNVKLIAVSRQNGSPSCHKSIPRSRSMPRSTIRLVKGP